MRHVTCYPANLNKPKAIEICRAFAQGVIACGGTAKVCTTIPASLEPGDAFFYGVRPSIAHLWKQCRSEGRTYFYGDNSFFDGTRERYFRVAKDRIQHDGRGRSDGRRFAALGLTVKPWRTGGDYTLICAQSEEFMRVVAGCPDWLDAKIETLRRSSERFIVRKKGGANRPFSFDLSRARKLITWSSAAAVMALLEGIPVECSDQCAAYGVTDRQKWAECLADNQFTLAEMSSGMAWRALG